MEQSRKNRCNTIQNMDILNVNIDHALDLVEATLNINYEDDNLDMYWEKMLLNDRRNFVIGYFIDKNFIQKCQIFTCFAQGNDTKDKDLFYSYKRWININ
jgi:hypothetical protein